MITLGIDIGSTTSKALILEDGKRILSSAVISGGIGTNGPQQAIEEAFESAALNIKNVNFSAVTGYGRNAYKDADDRISELTCHAIGGRFIFPDVRTIIDIGGQDAKVLSLRENGTMQNFVMNDKCAAGTGRFLDVMSGILQMKIDKMAPLCVDVIKPASISSTCTVFAESEVISQLANGVPLPELVAGICESVAGRVASLAKRVGIREKVCMSGGVAQNEGVRNAMDKLLGVPIAYSPLAQTFGALGAALYSYKQHK